MPVIVYVETNFLMSIALGREIRGYELLDCISSSVTVAIPSTCFMESFSVLEDEKNRRKRFREELDRQIRELGRDTTSANAMDLVNFLRASNLANGELMNDVQTRLFELVDRASEKLELIPETSAILRTAVTTTTIDDPTDNLILNTILDHARQFPDAAKALLTENTADFYTQEIRGLLNSAGITYFGHWRTCWIG